LYWRGKRSTANEKNAYEKGRMIFRCASRNFLSTSKKKKERRRCGIFTSVELVARGGERKGCGKRKRIFLLPCGPKGKRRGLNWQQLVHIRGKGTLRPLHAYWWNY